VRGVSFHVGEGEIFGLLGPNGAGKTTTIKMLVTLLTPSSGSARVLGFDVEREGAAVRRVVGCVFGGERGLYGRMTALENLQYFAELYGVSRRIQKQRFPELIELVGLTGRERDLVDTYSRGMKQRLHVARGLVHDPPVLFLDEPTIGVDPLVARELRRSVQRLADAGKSIILTTHYMGEADALCDRLAIINHGRFVAEGTPQSLKHLVADRTIVEIHTSMATAVMVARMRGIEGIVSVAVQEHEDGQVIRVQTLGDVEKTPDLLAHLGNAGVRQVVSREPTLEDAYVELVGESQ
jgi:ABC-2 type transport system ATP-binding protein